MALQLMPYYPPQTLGTLPRVEFEDNHLFTVRNGFEASNSALVYLNSADCPRTDITVQSVLRFRLAIVGRPWRPATQVDLALPGGIILRFSQAGVGYFFTQNQFVASSLAQPALPAPAVDEVQIELRMTNNQVVISENDRRIGASASIPEPNSFGFVFNISSAGAEMGIRVEDWSIVNIALA